MSSPRLRIALALSFGLVLGLFGVAATALGILTPLMLWLNDVDVFFMYGLPAISPNAPLAYALWAGHLIVGVTLLATAYLSAKALWPQDPALSE